MSYSPAWMLNETLALLCNFQEWQSPLLDKMEDNGTTAQTSRTRLGHVSCSVLINRAASVQHLWCIVRSLVSEWPPSLHNIWGWIDYLTHNVAWLFVLFSLSLLVWKIYQNYRNIANIHVVMSTLKWFAITECFQYFKMCCIVSLKLM